MEKLTLNVKIGCSHCVDGIKEVLEDVNGIQNIDIQQENKTVTVEFKKETVTISDIKKALIDADYM